MVNGRARHCSWASGRPSSAPAGTEAESPAANPLRLTALQTLSALFSWPGHAAVCMGCCPCKACVLTVLLLMSLVARGVSTRGFALSVVLDWACGVMFRRTVRGPQTCSSQIVHSCVYMGNEWLVKMYLDGLMCCDATDVWAQQLVLMCCDTRITCVSCMWL